MSNKFSDVSAYPLTPDEHQALAWYQSAKDDAFDRGWETGIDEAIEVLNSEISCDLNECQACEGLKQAINILKELQGYRALAKSIKDEKAVRNTLTEINARFPEVRTLGDV